MHLAEYVERVFGNDSSSSSEDSYVEHLLDRISNGVLAEDRRNAMVELESVVSESRAAQLAFGAMGFPVVLSVLKEERDDLEMSDADFYVRYYTLQLITALLTNSRSRVQEAILTIPGGITQLMDMLMDREVIRNEASLLLTYLTCEAEEIQKILVFEGAFVKIFSIIKEEGSSDGGVVVQDCLELLNYLLQNNTSNQVLLSETMGFDPLISILWLRGSNYKFTQQKAIILLGVLETIQLLMIGGPEADPGKDTNRLTNKTVLVQKNVLDYFLMLGVESQWAPVPVLQCIGELIAGHSQNRDSLASKVLGEEPHVELALNSLLRIILHTSSLQVFISADYVFKSFTSCRAASILSHVLKDNIQCKERVLKIELEAPIPSLGGSEPLMHRMVNHDCLRGLAAVLLGECVIYNKSNESGRNAIEDVDENEAIDQKNDHPMLVSTFDSQFVYFVKHLEGEIIDKTVEIYSHPKSQVAGVPAELEQRNGETDIDYIKRLRTFVERQCLEIQESFDGYLCFHCILFWLTSRPKDLLSRNVTLAEDLSRTGGNGSSELEHSGAERVQVETLKRDIQEASQRLEMLKTEKTRIESYASMYRNLAGTLEADLKSLSDAYNSLEQTNFHLENEVKSLSSGGSIPIPDVETLKAEAREEAQKESEAELNDLLVCLGQEQTKVERLSARLMELGEDVEISGMIQNFLKMMKKMKINFFVELLCYLSWIIT
ncbi:hypothetical protein ACH5RR_041621 [Cinchona calisaya]|uniref:Uso1/p115-like vesicle tethering protein C-terminal domain-containing protein n=1 Tax=Cinchona calisaya TaxID=153742 RepID=A0ABD2XZX2_9GENT